jgi:hypothetical protein
MGKTRPKAVVYTLPDCQRCEELKDWLSEEKIKFEAKSFTTEAQLDFIMRNIFGNPPILEFGKEIASTEDLFPNDALDEAKLKGVLGHG